MKSRRKMNSGSGLWCRRRSQDGYVLATTAVLMVALLGFAALVFDVGMMRHWKRRAQNAADAAAMGATLEVAVAGPGAAYVTAGLNEAARNGFTHGQGGATVTVTRPPTMGAYAGGLKYSEAVVTKNFPLTFMRLFGPGTASVTARAVSGGNLSDVCVYALAPWGNGTFQASGSAIFTNLCAIAVNSNSTTAMSLGSGSCVAATRAYVVGAASGILRKDCDPPMGTAEIQTDVPPAPDPFDGLPAPTPGACTANNFNSSGTQTIGPGTYCGGITLSGGNLHLQPGVYILKGGGLSVSGGTMIRGDGVTLYNTAGPGYAYKPITLNGGATVRLRAPTSGTYESILFFTDRWILDQSDNTISGNSQSYFEGSIYMPTVPVKLAGSGNVAAYTILVAHTVKVTGSAVFNNDYSTLTNGNPVKMAGAIIVE